MYLIFWDYFTEFMRIEGCIFSKPHPDFFQPNLEFFSNSLLKINVFISTQRDEVSHDDSSTLTAVYSR